MNICVQVFVWTYVFFKIFIRVKLIYNVVLVSVVQQSVSVIHIATLFYFILFPFFGRVLQNAVSQFPDQGSKLRPPQWKHGVVTTGPPGKSLYPLFQILFPYRSLRSTEKSSLCYTVGPYQLSILYIVACICQSQSPNSSLPSPGHMFLILLGIHLVVELLDHTIGLTYS